MLFESSLRKSERTYSFDGKEVIYLDETLNRPMEKAESNGQVGVCQNTELQHNGGNAVTEKQKRYIQDLAAVAGARVDEQRVTDKQVASCIIDQLKRLANIRTANSFDSASRDKREVFGMATKPVYRKWRELHNNPRKPKRIWAEVVELFEEYERQQDVAVNTTFMNAVEMAISK